jgi:dihydrofolate reductase
MAAARMTARVRLYAAVSLDGCLADAQGGVGWLAPFEAQDYGMDAFLAQVGAVLTGRTTYDQARRFGDWPYAGKRVVVMTHRVLDADAPDGVEAAQGDVAGVVARLRAEAEGRHLAARRRGAGAGLPRGGLVDSVEIFVMPLLLGAGLRLFATDGPPRALTLREARPYPNGVVALTYARA